MPISFLPRRPCRIWQQDILTLNEFGFDTSTDQPWGLRAFDPEAGAEEMDVAAFGKVIADRMAAGLPCPFWTAIRNVSDPQISADGLTLKQQAAIAAQIYKGFGRWSSVCSAITCWASIAAE